MNDSKPWLKQYPPEIPHNVDVAPLPSLVHMLDAALLQHADRPAITSLGRSTTYAELDQMSRLFAGWLQSQGALKGDRVAVMMPNVMPFAVAVLGTLRAGGTVVTINPLYTPRELNHQLQDSGTETLVVFAAFAGTVAQSLEGTAVKRIVVVKAGAPGVELPGQIDFMQALQAGAQVRFTPVELCGEDLAFLQYTGGTTGVSKGAMLKHSNIVANVAQTSAWMHPVMPDGASMGMNIACFLPLYHIFALTVCLMWGLRQGLHSVLIANPRDMAGAARELGGVAVHVFPGVNTLFGGVVANRALLEALNLSELRLAIGGGSAVQQGVAERWLAATGVPICEGYGLSETSPLASCNIVTAKAWSGTIGLPVSNTEIAIRDDEGRDVALGERGEICIRGPQVMGGYWRRPDETAKVMSEDGFFKTGDIGVMDAEGRVKIVDRKKDMILVSGFNVFPNEIEDVVSTLDGVLESAAIGVADEKSGEAVKLFVVRSKPELTVEQVSEHCRKHLTGYKNPRHIVFIEALPKTTVGKVLRRELRG
ncbi:MAG TPA: AMP-binding protein [Burkholderiaceae bacterium]|jgi:long-chain acyl-CoA synthetase